MTAGTGRGPSLAMDGKDTNMANTVYHYELGGAEAAGLWGFWGRLGRRLADYRLYRQTYDELAALSDRELADLGLTRHQVREVALATVYGG
jgi:uncharacterized protein YjiS (DUF1127 family)